MSIRQDVPAQVPESRGFGAGRVVAVVIGAVLALLGMVLLAGGGTAMWYGSQRDAHGYMMDATARASTPTAAIVSDRITLGGTRDIGFDWSGDVRISVRGDGGAPVFVGIARQSAVTGYLAGTAHDRVSVEDGGLYYRHHPRIRYHHMGGDLRALPRPMEQSFWVASAHGSGRQTMTWNPRDGDWVVVVANEDGRPGVHAMTTVGLRGPFLDWGGPALLVTGGVVLGVGILLIVVGLYRRCGEA